MDLRKRLWWAWMRRRICRYRGHRWTGDKFTDARFHVFCYRCKHRLTEADATRGEPGNYKLPWGDIRKIGGRLYE